MEVNKVEDEERKKAQSLEALGFDLLCFGSGSAPAGEQGEQLLPQYFRMDSPECFEANPDFHTSDLNHPSHSLPLFHSF